MFKNNEKERQAQERGAINLIGNGTRIKGEVHCSGDLRNDGLIEGKVESGSKVVLGNKGYVEGEIRCRNSDVFGRIKGKLFISDTLYLKASARIEGHIQTGKLIVESGAIFNGSCTMQSTEEPEEKTSGNGQATTIKSSGAKETA